MAVWDKKTLWGFLFLLAGAVGQTVIYEEPACAVKGSTVTLPCSFTPPKSFSQRGRDVPLEMVRVLWYQSQWHRHCHLTKPFVYDSDSKTNKQRFEYLGDKKTNCTLQIRDVQERDEGTFCFNMKINHTVVHFTESRGVTLRVVDGTKMRIISSSEDKKFSRGENVTLLCTSLCTFHQLEVTWFRDGHALSESGPVLQVGPLTAEDSGNYTCALKTNNNKLSEPYSLQVEAEEGVKLDKQTAVRLALFSTHTLLIIIVASVIIKGRVYRSAAGQQQRAEKHLKIQPPDCTEELRTKKEEKGHYHHQQQL